MADFICIKHPKYRGVSAPELSCKSCCALYIQKLRFEDEGPEAETDALENKGFRFDPYRWIAEKKQSKLNQDS